MGGCASCADESEQALACMSNAIGDLFRAASMTVASVAGTGRPILSFDAAVVSAALLNAPPVWYAPVTLPAIDRGVLEPPAASGKEEGVVGARGVTRERSDLGGCVEYRGCEWLSIRCHR